MLLFDCQDGNPNGDPDSDNAPRFDPETFQGLVSDVCLKRKVRDYVLYENSQNGTVRVGYDVYVLSGNTLVSRQEMAYGHLQDEGPGATAGDDIERARAWMCKQFFDVRAFGAVMSTKRFNCGQVRGPVQFTFSRSINRVLSTEHAITRQAFTDEEHIKRGPGTFGRKHTVAYGLYKMYGFVNPMFADKTGFSDEDLEMLWKALRHMFDLDRSAARGLMATRGLHIFKHASKLGNAPAQSLFESITVNLADGVESPRSFRDYKVALPEPSALPEGIELISYAASAAAA